MFGQKNKIIKQTRREKISSFDIAISLLVAAVFLIYYYSNPEPIKHFDYTFRVAENFLRGGIGFAEKPPSWLNEFVWVEDEHYSVFPLGSVLTMLPFAAFKVFGFIDAMPAAFISATTAAFACLFLILISKKYDYGSGKRVLLMLVPLFGSWMWTNETLAGAWQLALGFAVLGELGAIYFSIVSPKPFLAGAFFALAFGNRTEIILIAPLFMFLLVRNCGQATTVDETDDKPQKSTVKDFYDNYKTHLSSIAKFSAVPFLLGVSTLLYNYIRFDSPFDFGYARIPGVLNEPWYNHGIFSIRYIPAQAYEMLWKPWRFVGAYPFLLPDGFGNSILWSSPFLLLIFRRGARDKILKRAAWSAIFVLTLLLWTHGNAGGWQFSYRYAMILLPWIYLILLENSPRKISPVEWLLYLVSFIMNAYSIYLFHWTDYVKP